MVNRSSAHNQVDHACRAMLPPLSQLVLSGLDLSPHILGDACGFENRLDIGGEIIAVSWTRRREQELGPCDFTDPEHSAARGDAAASTPDALASW